MRGEHDGHPLARALEQDLRHQIGADRVEPREGLVEDQHVGLMHERDRQLDPLLVSQ